jgi:hypothetical protein
MAETNNEARFGDDYDRAIGALNNAQSITSTKPAMLRVAALMGVGATATYSVTTYRQEGELDEVKGRRDAATFTVFLEVAKGERLTRVVVPNDVVALIVRQRDALVTLAQKRAARNAAATRKARKA